MRIGSDLLKWLLTLMILHRVSLYAASDVCRLSVLDRGSLYTFSLASPTSKFPHGVLSEDGYSLLPLFFIFLSTRLYDFFVFWTRCNNLYLNMSFVYLKCSFSFFHFVWSVLDAVFEAIGWVYFIVTSLDDVIMEKIRNYFIGLFWSFMLSLTHVQGWGLIARFK